MNKGNIEQGKLWFVVPAAGVGKRFGGTVAKQYCQLAGKTIIEHTLTRLLALNPAGITIAIHPEDERWRGLDISRHPLIHTIAGGNERADSVRLGLQSLSAILSDNDWVLVHDVARPCVRVADMQRLVNQLQTSSVGGILAVPVSDTIKRVAADQIVSTQDRSTLWAAKTPQMFRYGLLTTALNSAHQQGLIPTDEAMAVELMGLKPQVMSASSDNIKITQQEDLAIAEAILALQAS